MAISCAFFCRYPNPPSLVMAKKTPTLRVKIKARPNGGAYVEFYISGKFVADALLEVTDNEELYEFYASVKDQAECIWLIPWRRHG